MLCKSCQGEHEKIYLPTNVIEIEKILYTLNGKFSKHDDVVTNTLQVKTNKCSNIHFDEYNVLSD